MNRIFKTAVLSAAVAGTMLAALPAANADDWGHHRRHHNGDAPAARQQQTQQCAALRTQRRRQQPKIQRGRRRLSGRRLPREHVGDAGRVLHHAAGR